MSWMQNGDHWDEVYGSKSPDQLSWFQLQPEPSLQLVQQLASSPQARIIDVGGGTSLLVDALLSRGYDHLTVLDLSERALATVQQRLEAQAAEVTWLAGDIRSIDLPHQAYDIWHDRAVFHFLVDSLDHQRYAEQVERSLRPTGHLILATFAEDGPERCSGLPVMRHSTESLQQVFGQQLQLQHQQRITHATPSGVEQKFLYTVWQRKAGGVD
jgi:2-polyprenyl-3-methyl-5-hydroxy-6-metoxy-1,4-benzoquinol methylase